MWLQQSRINPAFDASTIDGVAKRWGQCRHLRRLPAGLAIWPSQIAFLSWANLLFFYEKPGLCLNYKLVHANSKHTANTESRKHVCRPLCVRGTRPTSVVS